MRQGSAVKSEEKEYQQLQVTAQEEPPRHRKYGAVVSNPLKVIYALNVQFKPSCRYAYILLDLAAQFRPKCYPFSVT